MLQTVQQNGHVFIALIPKGLTVSLPQYACGQTTNASSQTTAATWRRTNVCSIYLTTPLLTTTMSQLQQLWKTCVFYAEQLATTLINGVQAFVQHLLNWLMTNQSPLMKMAFAAILINVIPNGSSLTPLIMT
jgi:hypothetical protein